MKPTNGHTIAALALVTMIASTASAGAQTASAVRGQALAQRNCSMCHAIAAKGLSPNGAAPPFRELRKRFVVDDLEAGVLAALLRGHPSMPEMRLNPGEIHDLLDYLRSLNVQKVAGFGWHDRMARI